MTATTEDQSLASIECIDYKLHDFEGHIDPENHLFNSINYTCDYYTEDQFNDSVSLDNKLSLIHFNCRSLYANFTKIKEYLSTLKNKLSHSSIGNMDKEKCYCYLCL